VGSICNQNQQRAYNPIKCMPAAPGEITKLLNRLNAGDTTAREQLLALVYDELRRRARAWMRGEGVDNTLQPTALVHEVWLRMIQQREWNLKNRADFFAMAAEMMRRILIDHARSTNAKKRGGDKVFVPLENAMAVAVEFPAQLLDLHHALEQLGQVDPHRARVVELRFFGGLSDDEIAEVTGVSSTTVYRQWRTARAWLSRELGGGSSQSAGRPE
jgi:RNA polymerase sigma-70 factor (ECF subfamily)